MANSYGYMPAVIHTIGGNGRIIPNSEDNPIYTTASTSTPSSVVGKNLVSVGNSTETPLLEGETFTGVGEDVLDYLTISVSVYSDVPSDDFGLAFQFSVDNINWVTTDEYTYTSTGVKKTYSIQRVSQYFRVVYRNSSLGVNQLYFSLYTIYNGFGSIASSHRIGDVISNEDDSQLTKSVLSAQRPTMDQINIGATAEGALLTSVVSPTGVLPVAQLTTLHDGKILNKLFPTINEIQGTGTGTFQTNKYNMAVTSGQWLVHQTKRFLPYYSGKPQKVELTFDKFAPEANVVKRVGYFSSNTTTPFNTTYDGIWLESGGGTIRMVIQRAGVTVMDQDISTWSGYDVLNGYQDLARWDEFTVIEFNFLWLGGAYIELRLVTDGGFTTVNSFVYAGTSQDVFIQSPNQPVRYEIRSTTGTGSFRYICNQVATSGSINESGLSTAITTGTTPINITSIGTKYPIMAVRKQLAYRDNPVRILTANLFVTSADQILWTMEINPTLSAALTFNTVANSAVESANGNGTITVTAPGTIIAADYTSQLTRIPVEIFKDNYLSWLGGTLAGVQDSYVLCATPLTVNVSTHAAMILMEG